MICDPHRASMRLPENPLIASLCELATWRGQASRAVDFGSAVAFLAERFYREVIR
jgi:hypothetical protein